MRESARRFDSTIRCLAERWSDAGLLLPAFPLLARGEPLSVSRIAKKAGINDHEVEEALINARCAFNDNGLLIDLFGMMLTPSYHRLEIDGKVVFSCCALWAHVIPKLIDRTVLVESVDPHRRDLVRLEIAPGQVQSVDPGTSLATMAVADAASIQQDVGSAFCHHVRYFTSSDSARKFAAESRSRRVVEIDELHAIAAQLHEAILESAGENQGRRG